MKESKIQAGQDTFDLDVDPRNTPFVERHLCGHTRRDRAVQSLPAPAGAVWLRGVVWLLRLYRRILSQRLGNRCVFDPSCSHYAELAYRHKGFLKGTTLTMSRLCRCRPGNGGIDELT